MALVWAFAQDARMVVGLGHALPLFFGLASLPRSLSIQGISDRQGHAKVGGFSGRRAALLGDDLRSISRMALLGSSSRDFTSAFSVPYWVSNSRICCAPPPEAAW